MGCQWGKTTVVEEPGPLKSSAKSAASKPTVSVSKDVVDKKVAQAQKTGVLALRECGLKALPSTATAAEAAGLRTADLSSNLLKALPDNISSWTSLQNLLCAQNALSELPASLGQLASLQKLVLSSNQLRTLPQSLTQLGKVKVLQLDGNLLGPRLPPDIFGGALPASLEELDISGNELEELPVSVTGLAKLVRLAMPRNKVVALPAELGGLTKLQHLDAAENLLTAIPPAVVAAASLSELWLKGNPMDRLQLQAMPGFAEFLERRKQRLDAKIDANVVGQIDLSVCGLD
eukprot:TRINITY_DN49453_c0_g1_i1.p1 TRINITY_DN49453_c0_g1~~TRINITY_DN49453_c0_g1_i1.p1  ORF type:complete len:290 (+),score=65.54 TRINITY_DN49453_c0_g1_i1:28-897(+)